MINGVNEKLKLDFKLVTTWFFKNSMLPNPSKRYYMCLESKIKKRAPIGSTLNFYNQIEGTLQKGLL